METKELTKALASEEKSGEELLKEYNAQDKDNGLYTMGYAVYSQTHTDGCC
ncbi:MAG: hypothetical protein J6C23_04010 [Clostridia bacterium]|nr:hypothetical protein [Clostridia bacterium]